LNGSRNSKQLNENGAGNSKHKSKKVIYFDSNDEMLCESDISESEVNGDESGKNKNYTKVLLKATEDEKKRIREMINK
jgi:hypothetical protein